MTITALRRIILVACAALAAPVAAQAAQLTPLMVFQNYSLFTAVIPIEFLTFLGIQMSLGSFAQLLKIIFAKSGKCLRIFMKKAKILKTELLMKKLLSKYHV